MFLYERTNNMFVHINIVLKKMTVPFPSVFKKETVFNVQCWAGTLVTNKNYSG